MTEPLPSPAGAPALCPASIRRRLAAFVYESVLLFGVVFVAGLAFSVVMQERNGLTLHNQLSAWIAVVVGVYFVGLWHAGGQTLPMKTWRLRVVGPTDTPPSLGRATIRYLAAWLGFLPPLALHPLIGLSLPHTLMATGAWFVLWAASARFGTGRQFPHDRIAGTRVVDLRR
ncbi:MAG TPA: RDD family protein [Paraburkholderia sp.]